MSYSNFLGKIIKKEAVQVFKLIHKCIHQKKLQVLVAVPYEKEQQWYAEKLRKRGYTVEIINASTKTKDRTKVFEAYDEGNIDIIIGYNVLKKGISIPQMGCLLDVYASETKENVTQLIGRLNRKGRGITKKFYFAFTKPLVLGKQHRLKKKLLPTLAKQFGAKFKKFDI